MILDLINQQKDRINELAGLIYSKGLSSRDIPDVMERSILENQLYNSSYLMILMNFVELGSAPIFNRFLLHALKSNLLN
jgi:hypothetical protein